MKTELINLLKISTHFLIIVCLIFAKEPLYFAALKNYLLVKVICILCAVA